MTEVKKSTYDRLRKLKKTGRDYQDYLAGKEKPDVLEKAREKMKNKKT